MSQHEKKRFEEAADSYRKKVTSTKKASQKFLIELGVFTKKGNVRKAYKDLCIPQGQD